MKMSPSEQVIVNCWYRVYEEEWSEVTNDFYIDSESLEFIPETNQKVSNHLDIAPSRIEEVVNAFVIEA